jgi:hypothetical protein
MRLSASIAILALVCFATYVSAQPNKELYDLRERCGKQATEVFEREYMRVLTTENGQTRFNYENHYNARLNKCFFLEIAVSYERQGGKPTTSKMMRLFELNDNKEYGVFMSGFSDDSLPFACLVQDDVYRSASEWRKLLKPFMEE